LGARPSFTGDEIACPDRKADALRGFDVETLNIVPLADNMRYHRRESSDEIFDNLGGLE
jgi:hypothetical protein